MVSCQPMIASWSSLPEHLIASIVQLAFGDTDRSPSQWLRWALICRHVQGPCQAVSHTISTYGRHPDRSKHCSKHHRGWLPTCRPLVQWHAVYKHARTVPMVALDLAHKVEVDSVIAALGDGCSCKRMPPSLPASQLALISRCPAIALMSSAPASWPG